MISSTTYGGSFESFKITIENAKKYFDNVYVVFLYRKSPVSLDMEGIYLQNIKIPDLHKVIFMPILEAKIKPALKNILENNDFDLILSYALILTSSIGELAKSYNIPVILNINSFTKFRAKPIASHYFHKACENCWGLMFASNTLRKDFMKYHNITHSNTHIIPMPIDTEKFSPSDKPNNKDNLIAVGRLVKLKRYDLLLKAMSIISREKPSVKLIIVGDGPQRKKLQKIASQLNIEKNVEFIGYRENMVEIYRNGAILVHPSEYETFSRVITEALSCQVPVVSCSGGGPEEILADDTGGFLVEPRPDKIAEKVIFLLENPKIYAKLGAQGRKRVIQHYSIPVFAKRMEKIYKLALEGDYE